jgi:hypothetical protein
MLRLLERVEQRRNEPSAEDVMGHSSTGARPKVSLALPSPSGSPGMVDATTMTCVGLFQSVVPTNKPVGVALPTTCNPEDGIVDLVSSDDDWPENLVGGANRGRGRPIYGPRASATLNSGRPGARSTGRQERRGRRY